jgi:hypothetical protein
MKIPGPSLALACLLLSPLAGADVSVANPVLEVEKYSITGHIAKLSADFRATLKMSGNRKPTRTITAQADGSFAFRSVGPGSYTIRPSHPKFSFSPTFHTVAVTTHDVGPVAFTAHERGKKKR